MFYIFINFEISSHIKGYHVYRNIWTPTLQEELYGEMDPANPVDKHAVAVKKNNVVVGHLPLGNSFNILNPTIITNVASNRKDVCLHLHLNLVEDLNVLNSLVLFLFKIIRPLV